MTPTRPALLAELRRLADAVDALETASGYECGYGDSLRRIAEKADALESDARRYRWLRDPEVDPGTVIDKRVPWQNKDGETESIDWEYRSGDELDAAIDKAMAALAEQGEPK